MWGFNANSFDYKQPQPPNVAVLIDDPTITWSCTYQIATLTLRGNRVMGKPQKMEPGSYILIVNQDGTGSRTITWDSAFKWAAGAAPILSTAANAKDVFSFFCDGTFFYGSYLRGVA